MESNSVCNHTSNWENRRTAKGECNLSVTSLRKKLDIGYTFSWKDHGSVAEMRDNSACIWHALSTYTGMTCQLFYSVVQLQAWHLRFPIGAQIELVITNHMREFCSCFDRPRNWFQTRLSFVTAQRCRRFVRAKKTYFCQINLQWHWLMLIVVDNFYLSTLHFFIMFKSTFPWAYFGRLLVKFNDGNSLISLCMLLYQFFLINTLRVACMIKL